MRQGLRAIFSVSGQTRDCLVYRNIPPGMEQCSHRQVTYSSNLLCRKSLHARPDLPQSSSECSRYLRSHFTTTGVQQQAEDSLYIKIVCISSNLVPIVTHMPFKLCHFACCMDRQHDTASYKMSCWGSLKQAYGSVVGE